MLQDNAILSANLIEMVSKGKFCIWAHIIAERDHFKNDSSVSENYAKNIKLDTLNFEIYDFKYQPVLCISIFLKDFLKEKSFFLFLKDRLNDCILSTQIKTVFQTKIAIRIKI